MFSMSVEELTALDAVQLDQESTKLDFEIGRQLLKMQEVHIIGSSVHILPEWLKETEDRSIDVVELGDCFVNLHRLGRRGSSNWPSGSAKLCDFCSPMEPGVLKKWPLRGLVKQKSVPQERSPPRIEWGKVTEGYQCKMCGEVWPLATALEVHYVQDHHLERRVALVCAVCGAKFMLSYEYKEHVAMHGNRGIKQCQLCHKSYKSTGGLYTHRQSHKSYSCYLCYKSFPTPCRLRCHFNAAHGGSPKQQPTSGTDLHVCHVPSMHVRQNGLFRCFYCSHSSSVRNNLLFHCQRYHCRNGDVEKQH